MGLSALEGLEKGWTGWEGDGDFEFEADFVSLASYFMISIDQARDLRERKQGIGSFPVITQNKE